METHFQTSFIPKKPLAQSEGSNPAVKNEASLIFSFGLFLFIVSILITGGAYGWKYYLIQQRTTYINTLKEQQTQFNPSRITLLKSIDTKIGIAKTLLANHLAISQIFDKIARLTADNIRFVSMDVSSPGGGKSVTVSLNGYGPSYQVVAFQSDALGKLELQGLRGEVINPVLSNPVQNQNSTVSFDFSATINPASILYNSVQPSSAQPRSKVASSTTQQ